MTRLCVALGLLACVVITLAAIEDFIIENEEELRRYSTAAKEEAELYDDEDQLSIGDMCTTPSAPGALYESDLDATVAENLLNAFLQSRQLSINEVAMLLEKYTTDRVYADVYGNDNAFEDMAYDGMAKCSPHGIYYQTHDDVTHDSI